MPIRTITAALRAPRMALLMMVSVALTGCATNPLHSVTGMVMTDYAEKENTPYVLEMHDIEMACSLGESVDPLLYSFSRVTAAPETTGTLLSILSGICMEQVAVEEELRYLRADYRGDSTETRDARAGMQRKFGITAERRVEAFERVKRAYDYDPSPDDHECPTLSTDQDEITFLLGLAAGAQAVLDDAKARGWAGVSRSLAPQVERSAACLDNEKWAGLPDAIRASVWVLLPDTKPSDDIDPWGVMEANRELAHEGGIRTAVAIELMMAENVDRQDVIADALHFLAENQRDFTPSEPYRLVDRVGMRMAWATSDRFWTREHGHRTPNNRFGRTGTELDEREEREEIDTEGLL